MSDESALQNEALDQARLGGLDDAALHALINSAHAILSERENTRRKDALARIRAIAKAHGMSVSVQDKGKRTRRASPAA
jgi:hypothetical protein